jgi:hypothetical protein
MNLASVRVSQSTKIQKSVLSDTNYLVSVSVHAPSCWPIAILLADCHLAGIAMLAC